MRKIITFLGTKPIETQYQFGGQVFKGRVFAEALRQFVAFDKMLVFVTEEARRESLPVLEALNDPRLLPVSIPRGETTREMWQMFSTITEHVDEGESVIFDITHGLRSLPFLVFLFAAYLQSAKKANIEAIYYGAFELGQPKENKPAPVIDLTEFVRMLDWLVAAERFTDLGDAKLLADLLKQERQARGRSASTPAEREQVGAFGNAANSTESVSEALRLVRPIAAMDESAKLAANLERARPRLAEWAQPFAVLMDAVITTYGPLGLESAAQGDARQSLQVQRRMVTWYLDRGLVLQAVTLAREWVVSWVMFRMGYTEPTNREDRETVEALINADLRELRNSEQRNRTPRLHLAAQLPGWQNGIELWSQLGNLRNDLDHAGFRKGARRTHNLVADAQRLCPRLDEFSLEAQS